MTCRRAIRRLIGTIASQRRQANYKTRTVHRQVPEQQTFEIANAIGLLSLIETCKNELGKIVSAILSLQEDSTYRLLSPKQKAFPFVRLPMNGRSRGRESRRLALAQEINAIGAPNSVEREAQLESLQIQGSLKQEAIMMVPHNRFLRLSVPHKGQTYKKCLKILFRTSIGRKMPLVSLLRATLQRRRCLLWV